MKHRIRYLLGGAAVSIGLATNASAAMLSADNSVNFAGSAQFDSTSLSTATTVESWWTAVAPSVVASGFSRVQSSTGAEFGATIVDGALVDMNQPWNIGSGVNDLWSVGGFTFDLTSSTLDFQSGSFLNASGTGWITGNGYDATPGSWWFTAQLPEADGRFSYSAGTSANPGSNVPDGGSAFALLGLALGGMEALRRRRKAVAA